MRADDAGAPGTEIEALLQNGACPDVFFSTNMMKCFGYVAAFPVGPVPRKAAPRFSVPWWFRTTFRPSAAHGEHAVLLVNGVVGQADVWLNGHEVASQATVQGAYTRYSFDVTRALRRGLNALALKLYPNDPGTMYTLDDVDWNQIPPDNNTGIQFPVELQVSPALSLDNSHVVQRDTRSLSRAALTVKADVTNRSARTQRATVRAEVMPPGHTSGPITVRQHIVVPPHGTRTVVFAPRSFPRLTVRHPRIWWPYQMGGQPLYLLSVSLRPTTGPPEEQRETFGIRTLTSYLIGRSPMAPQGVRVFAVNGVPIVIRSGGWAPNLFLHYSARDIANQVKLIKNLGLNAIRLEGHEMPPNFYEQMDRAGILVDGGFQCCDAWAPNGDGSLTAHDLAVLGLSAYTIGQELRNHPSVMNYSWSDNAPTPRQERVSLAGFSRADFQDPLVCSAEYNSCQKLAPAGEHEGPYDWVPPTYWYENHYDASDATRTNSSGAWGFDSEQSAGDTVPTMDSIRRFMSTSDQSNLWLNPAYNQYHLNYEPDFISYEFGTLYWLDQAIRARYGSWSSLAQYVEEAQAQDYEDVRAQFEANLAHWHKRPTPSTGTDYWMVNKGWPTLLWDLYNYDYDQAGSYFGAQKANRPLHVQYALDTGRVVVDNLSRARRAGLSVVSRVYATSGQLLDQRRSAHLTLPGAGVRTLALRPKVPAPTAPPLPARTYFIELVLDQHHRMIDRNVYWLSTQPDVVDWKETVSPGQPRATLSQYADLTALHRLAEARISVTATSRRSSSGAVTTLVRITNVSGRRTVAFFLRADVRRGARPGGELPGDNEVRPILWSDNDITLWPGESETLRASYRAAALRGAAPVVSIGGWNISPRIVPAR